MNLDNLSVKLTNLVVEKCCDENVVMSGDTTRKVLYKGKELDRWNICKKCSTLFIRSFKE